MQVFFLFFFNLKFQQIGWSKRTFRHAYIAWRLGAQTGSSTSHSNWRVCFSTGFLGRWLAWPLWLMTSYAMGLIIFRTKSTFLKLCSNTSWSLLRHCTLFHFTSQAEIETKSTCATPDSRGGFISSAFACCWNESNLQFLDRSDMRLTYLQIRVILKSIGFLIKLTFPIWVSCFRSTEIRLHPGPSRPRHGGLWCTCACIPGPGTCLVRIWIKELAPKRLLREWGSRKWMGRIRIH